MNLLIKYSFLLLITYVFASCSTTKLVPEHDKLYTGANIKLSTVDVPARTHKVVKSDLEGLTRPRPNSRFLGIPFKLAIYNMFGNRKPNSFFGRLRDKWGEPPVLLSNVNIETNVKNLQNHLENTGFFNATVTGDTIVKGKKAKAEYEAAAGNQYKIASVAFENDSSVLERTIQESVKSSLLKKDDPYDLDVIRAERTRIDAYLKERGFYYFTPDYLIVKVDSTIGNFMVDMRVSVKPETPAIARQVYTINDVYIYSGYNITTAERDTSLAHAEFHKGYYVIDPEKRYKPKMFEYIMQFQPGEVYNRTDHNRTLRRLINLNEFQHVRNRFEPVPDSTELDAFYYLTPLPKKTLRADLNFTTKSNNLNGTELRLNWRNRNTFRAGEQLQASAYIASEIQFGGTFKGYNVYRTGAELNFTIPRFITPLFDLRVRGGYVPRTNIQLGYDVLHRMKLYTLNSFRGGLGYLWKTDVHKQHELYPITINYVQPINVTQEYRDSLFKYPYLERIIDSQFILGSTYQYNYNQAATGVQKINSFYFNGLADLSGNIAGLITGANVQNGDKKRLFNAPFDQYIKLEVDGRYYRRFGLKSSWANRLVIGYGNPWGNSVQLPYIKQFFVGGNNSIRAFRSRSIGPGSFPLLSPNSEFFPDQTGDIKLEMNTEYRPHISGPLYGAVFIDAGNIWLKNEDPNRPGAKFSKDFLKQLAVGGGVGVRLDIVLFVIRLDVAIPLHEPWKEHPWVISRPDSRLINRESIMFNLGIGYPF